MNSQVPPGARVYAIGDVHGCFDLLAAMVQAIARDAARRPAERIVEVFLGDYVDRGPNSFEVLEKLMASPAHGGDRICLLGNHEDTLLRFLEDASVWDHWSTFGGIETLLSYGLDGAGAADHAAFRRLQMLFKAALPERHLRFLQELQPACVIGDYLFVHAGLRPGIPVERQRLQDLIWIRDEFLTSRQDFGKFVVHGHTPVREPEVLPNRINIDTGAVFTGRLTCLVLEGEEMHFLEP